MKRLATILLLCLAGTSATLSQDVLQAGYRGPKIWVTAGLKGWYGSWNIFSDTKEFLGYINIYDQYGNYLGTGTAYLEGKESAGGFLGGPYVSVKVGSFTGSISFATTVSSFEPSLSVRGYDQYGAPVPVYDAYGRPVGDLTTSISRQDFNLLALYSVRPEFGIFGTLKLLSYKWKVSFMGYSVEEKANYTGFGGGINSTYRFPGSPMYLYGYLGALYNSTSTSGMSNETVFFFDGGLGYRFVAAGIRVESGAKDGTRTILGPVVSLYYTF